MFYNHIIYGNYFRISLFNISLTLNNFMFRLYTKQSLRCVKKKHCSYVKIFKLKDYKIKNNLMKNSKYAYNI